MNFEGITKNKKLNIRFSVHEHGIYDTPATVDHILKETGQEGLFLVGISMGALISCIFLSMKPEYNKRIKSLVLLGPPIVYERSGSLKKDSYQFVLVTFIQNVNLHRLQVIKFTNCFFFMTIAGAVCFKEVRIAINSFHDHEHATIMAKASYIYQEILFNLYILWIFNPQISRNELCGRCNADVASQIRNELGMNLFWIKFKSKFFQNQ